MQLITHTCKSFVQPNTSLIRGLQEILLETKVEQNFRINHSDFETIDVPEATAERLHRLPLNLQRKYTVLQLRGFIYGVYYNGSLRKALASKSEKNSDSVLESLENNTFLGVNLELYEKLHRNNSGTGYFSPGWLVTKQEEDGNLAVHRGGLTLYIEPQRHLKISQQSATVGDSVAVRMPRNLFQNGFYVAVGNAGPESLSCSPANTHTVRVYLNLDPEGAVAVMANLTKALNSLDLPFSFKALYNPSDYDRYDSAVLYFKADQYKIVRPVLRQVYSTHQSHFNTETPLFTKLLAPGLSLAEEPDCKFATKESFGLNRCQIVANGLLDAFDKGLTSPEDRLDCVLKQFHQLGLNWQKPYLNATSEDIYGGLDL